MEKLSGIYERDAARLSELLRVTESFDVIERKLSASGQDISFFYIDGFVKDAEMLKLMQFILNENTVGDAEAVKRRLPYVEVDGADDMGRLVAAVLSGQAVMLATSFGRSAILIDVRTYPARTTAEPDTDRVMQGARDGFVETLVMNTALIRRRIRDPRLTMRHFSVGEMSRTDVVMCYIEGVADGKLVEKLEKRLREIKPKSLTLGYRSLAESLIRRGWLNPFPKVRTTERPDTAAAQVLEGSVLIICDTTPQVMILPTSIFDYLSQADDYYFPPLTGSYLRIIRVAILLLSMIATPLWYLYLEYSDVLPEALRFLIPDDPGALPIILQLLLVEVAIDGLKIASMNTPDMLSNSLSIVGALILGDFAVAVGWLCPDVILYMAFVAIATFAQQNAELSYAIKFVRVLTLIFVFGFGVWGLLLGGAVFVILLLGNRGVTGERKYLYPLIPFNGRALLRLLVRTKKHDFESKE
ncbi:MAG: spore germination protein [Clostridia bacterium]|nr:spore germination protein [Clostridia bacterium]